ncbi:hypothetical protein SME10J_23740 [Serratia marcescens]|nr:hypothetical protein SME10J_23740 [Serratia marcescens]
MNDESKFNELVNAIYMALDALKAERGHRGSLDDDVQHCPELSNKN